MNKYELIYIIDAGLEETARKELIDRVSALITGNGGEVDKVDETWGKRRLAYVIDHKTEGWYVLVNFKGPAELPREIERNLGINENVLRSLIVKQEEKRSVVKPRAPRPEPAEAHAEKPAETPVEASAEASAESVAADEAPTPEEAADKQPEAAAETADASGDPE